jgi:hypothetical protein
VSDTTPASTPHPWDQQSGEPDNVYARFLFYRSLGPSRSMDMVYRLLHPAKKGEKS